MEGKTSCTSTFTMFYKGHLSTDSPPMIRVCINFDGGRFGTKMEDDLAIN